MARRIIMLAGLAAIIVVLAAYLGLSHGVRAWFGEGSRHPTEAAQERTLATKHAEMTLPAELVAEAAPPMAALPYIDDFEGPWPGAWQGDTGGDPDWIRVDCNSHSPIHSASPTDPTCTTYGNNWAWWLVYGPFDLTGAAAGGVQFWFDLDTEEHDFLLAYVSTDGQNWYGRGCSGDSGGWTNNSAGLCPGFAPWDFGHPNWPVLGQPQVWFAFVFWSDLTLTGRGAWVDDVCIWRDDPSVCGGPTPTPTPTPPPGVPVEIDIKPGSYPNSINLKSKGVIPVAILTSEDFDATTVDPETVHFATCLAVHHAMEDVDHDGDLDLILHFRTRDTDIQPGDTEPCLTGETYDGVPIMGCDSVRTVPPR